MRELQCPSTRDLAQEVALIQKKLQPDPDSGASVEEAESNGNDPGEHTGKKNHLFLSTTGSRFDILVHGSGVFGEMQHKQLMRVAKTQVASPTRVKSEGVDRRYGPSSRPKTRVVPQPFSHLLVCDFEATCDTASVHYPHEIIEFPVVCVDTATLCTVAEFHSFVRPTRNPRLTSFCTTLTGITQAQVDAAPTLPEVVKKFSVWLRDVLYPLCRVWREEHGYKLSRCLRVDQRRFAYDEEHNAEWVEYEKMVCMVTDGPWDMRKFMHECSVLRDGHCFPPLFYRWVNLRHCFAEHFRSHPRKLTSMLRRLGLTFQGQEHSGIDDSRNIARVLIELLWRGYCVRHVSTIKYISTDKNAAMEMRRLLEELGEDDLGPQHRSRKKKKGGAKAALSGGRK